MMASLKSRERNEKQWHLLLESVGLKVQKIYTYTDFLEDSIIVAVIALVRVLNGVLHYFRSVNCTSVRQRTMCNQIISGPRWL